MWGSYLIIAIVSAGAAGLTFFSGFGLGTLLLPVFALFFPTPQAVALTAVVHLLNNFFKLSLTCRQAQWRVVLRFGLPAMIAAFAGAQLLLWLGELEPLGSYRLGGHVVQIDPINLIIGLLIFIFVVLEFLPAIRDLAIAPQYLPIGGFLSGFFGGLSGHQGAFRSMFLVKAGLGKEAFIATGVVIAVLVDLTRLATYFEKMANPLRNHLSIVLTATSAAFIGSWLGNHFLKKTTYANVQRVVSILLILIAVGLGSGLLAGQH
ncbi:MAG: hypothetical protein HJJLKODD_02420 [Phycisphaerae bacterium]|nr:hypothetical protein [Phycisphaerae bacterium]